MDQKPIDHCLFKNSSYFKEVHRFVRNFFKCVLYNDYFQKSIHHHFPTKAMMAAAVARRYADRFFAQVAPRDDEGPDDVVARYHAVCKASFDRSGKTCLFGVLGAEGAHIAAESAPEPAGEPVSPPAE